MTPAPEMRIDKLREHVRVLREALKCVIGLDADSFEDIWRNGDHDTQHVCIGCGARGARCEDDCVMSEVRAALAQTEEK